MSEHVVPIDLGVDWNHNTEDYLLMQSGAGRAVLVIDANWGVDPDLRTVLLTWTGVAFASMGGPNDEALSGHRLYSKGLDEVVWSGTVEESELIELLVRQNSVHPHHRPDRWLGLTHYVLPLKGDVLEVVADAVSFRRFEGNLRQAAASVFEGRGTT
jgi:hypothetical protein